MQKKSIQTFVYIIQSLFSATVYGLFTFFVIYGWLAGEVILYAYALNVLFIVLFLLVDKHTYAALLSEDLVNTKKSWATSMLLWSANFVSFKTMLYMFYTFVLIVSRVSMIEPNLFSERMMGFVLSIEYCLILLVAFDKFIEHLAKDDRRIKAFNAKFAKLKKYVANKREKRRRKK